MVLDSTSNRIKIQNRLSEIRSNRVELHTYLASSRIEQPLEVRLDSIQGVYCKECSRIQTFTEDIASCSNIVVASTYIRAIYHTV